MVTSFFINDAARDHFHAVVLGDKLYVAGGRNSTHPSVFNEFVREVDVFDLRARTWSTLRDLPRPRGGVCAAAFKKSVYMLGGEGGDPGRAWAEVDVLKDGKTLFKPGPDMPGPRHGAGAVSCNGALWVAGGVSVLGGGTFSGDTVALFDGDDVPPCTGPDPTTTSPTSTTATTATSVTTATTTATSNTTATTTASSATTVSTTASSATTAASNATSSAPATTAVSSTTTSNAMETVGSTTVSTSSVSSASTTQGTPTSATVTPTPTSEVPKETAGTSPAASPSAAVAGVSATPSETASSQAPDEGSACFPSDAVVELEDGSVKKMSELCVGDVVRVGEGEYSEIYFFSHRDTRTVARVIELQIGAGRVLSVSAGHLIYANGALVAAGEVEVGDEVSVSGARAAVTRRKVVLGRGMHNPHTMHGDIVVNGVLVSTFTNSVHPGVAKFVLAPFRVLYRALGAGKVVHEVNGAVLRALEYGYWGW